jgi:hypothetical protein
VFECFPFFGEKIMKVVLFAGAALVTGVAMFGAVRASQEATPVVVAETKRVIRQVTQTELVEQLKAEVASLRSAADEVEALRPLAAEVKRLTAECDRLRGELAREIGIRAGYVAK